MIIFIAAIREREQSGIKLLEYLISNKIQAGNCTERKDEDGQTQNHCDVCEDKCLLEQQ